MSRMVQPTGLLVAMLGADGAGKSTVLAQVEDDLAPAYRRTKRYHLRPHFGRVTADGPAVVDPTRNRREVGLRPPSSWQCGGRITPLDTLYMSSRG